MHTTALAVATLALANPFPAPAQPLITPGAGLLAVPAPGLAPRQQFSLTGSRAKSVSCMSEYLSLAQDAPTPTDGDLFTLLRSIGESFAVTATAGIDDSLTTLCAASASITPPASLSSAYDSYTSEVHSWASSVADEARSIASECGGEVSAMMQFLIVTNAESCTRAVQVLVDVYEDMLSSGTRTGTAAKSTTRTRVSTSATASGDEAVSTSTSGTAGDDEETETGARSATAPPQSTGGGGGENTNAVTTTTSSSIGGAAAPRETGFVAAAAAVVLGVAGVVAAL
ncbi:hypothetical protein N657DRAFT_644284 [Parathielavia appendiculata]|uniref:DUF7735 domain-containing protein n=1 Tax=Parathielavia appendiculata TaxID=2587402 RepID=A0AAN6U1G9_9PEZI|nr:hypothetical protein N657DRAFT_644284 [Parathielavia appendiculata]